MATPKKKLLPFRRVTVIHTSKPKPKPTLTFEPFKDAAGEWRWRMRHRNGNIQAMSSESYKRRATMLRVLARQINVLTARNYIIGPTVS